MAELELSPAVFSILSGLIEEKAGLHYGPPDHEILHEKASARAVEAGFESLLDYYYYLRYDPAGEQEFSAFVDNLVVNETYFFREWRALEVLVDAFLKPWCQSGRRPRVWSAACATGEEPLSLAMLLDDRGILDQVEIVATDISDRALTKAQQNRHGRRSIRQVPDARFFERYIRPQDDGYTVDSKIHAAVRWEKLNLLGSEDFLRLGRFDVILCRNVLIYFADATICGLLGRLSRSLVCDGVLLVGVSESLLRYGSNFLGEERHGVFLYRQTAERKQP